MFPLKRTHTCSVVVLVRLAPHTGVVEVPVRVVLARHVWLYQADVLDDLEMKRQKRKLLGATINTGSKEARMHETRTVVVFIEQAI